MIDSLSMIDLLKFTAIGLAWLATCLVICRATGIIAISWVAVATLTACFGLIAVGLLLIAANISAAV